MLLRFKLASLQTDHLSRQKNVLGLRKALRDMPVKLDDFYMEALERIECDPQANEVVPRLFKWLARGGDMHSDDLEVLLALEPDLEVEDWAEEFCHQDMKVDVLNYVSMSEGLLRNSSGKISFAHETILYFLLRARLLLMDDWCLRSAAAFLSLPISLRNFEEITRNNEGWLQPFELWSGGTKIVDCFTCLSSSLRLRQGMAWLVPEDMPFREAHRLLWKRVEEELHLSSTIVCVQLNWLDHALESVRHGQADLTSKDSDGSTMMHLVMKNVAYETWGSFSRIDRSFIRTLVSNGGAIMSTQDYAGQTPLHVLMTNASVWDTYCGIRLEIEDYWAPLFTGPHCMLFDERGLTPLHVAAQTANIIPMRMLTRFSPASVNSYSVQGHTPVQWTLHSLWAVGQNWLMMKSVRRFVKPTTFQEEQYESWGLRRVFCIGMISHDPLRCF